MRVPIIYLLFLVLNFAVAAFGQKISVGVQPCNLGLQDAPKLRGFYLGESNSEIENRIPGFLDEYDKASSNYYSYPSANFRIVVMGDLSHDPEFDDVSVLWHLSDGKVVRLYVTYTEFQPKSLKDFINQTAKTTGMPIASFRITDKHRAKLTCNGFSLEVNEGNYSRVGWYPEGSNLMLEDTNEIGRLDVETKKYQAGQKREALRQKAEEEKRKHTLKP